MPTGVYERTAESRAITSAAGLRRSPSPESRFWSKVDQSGECWLWLGAQIPRGYGRFLAGGQIWYVHRWVWEHVYGPIPEGIQVCHSCDNPSCVRPVHLFLGTQSDNIQDAVSKGRLWQQAVGAGAKMSAARKGKGLGNQNRLGQTVSAETRAKISAARTGQTSSAEACTKISASLLGNKRALKHGRYSVIH